MPTIKGEVIELIKRLPDDIDIDDIMEELYFRLKVDQGLKDIEEGNIIPHSEMILRF